MDELSSSSNHRRVFFINFNPIELGVSEHPDVQVGVSNPAHSLSDIADRTQDHLSAELVGELRDQLRLDGQLHVVHREIVLQLGVICDYYALSKCIVLRPSCSAHHLKNVLRAQLDPLSLLWAVDLRTFNDHCVSGQVNTPSERGSRAEDLKVTRSEQIFNHFSVSLRHACVMNAKTKWHHIFEILRVTLINL